MNDVRALGKTQRNEQQGFNFRGVDSVMNVVGPALRDHGLVVSSIVHDLHLDTYPTSAGREMNRAIVKVEYRFTAPDDTYVSAAAYGEASDTMDKSVSKAMSVAYRTAILQALCLPTHEPDPDAAEQHERTAAAEASPKDQAIALLRTLVRTRGLGEDNVPAAFHRKMGKTIPQATADEVQDYTAFVRQTGRLDHDQLPAGEPGDPLPGDEAVSAGGEGYSG
jgi:hypothetical protein